MKTLLLMTSLLTGGNVSPLWVEQAHFSYAVATAERPARSAWLTLRAAAWLQVAAGEAVSNQSAEPSVSPSETKMWHCFVENRCAGEWLDEPWVTAAMNPFVSSVSSVDLMMSARWPDFVAGPYQSFDSESGLFAGMLAGWAANDSASWRRVAWPQMAAAASRHAGETWVQLQQAAVDGTQVVPDDLLKGLFELQQVRFPGLPPESSLQWKDQTLARLNERIAYVSGDPFARPHKLDLSLLSASLLQVAPELTSKERGEVQLQLQVASAVEALADHRDLTFAVRLVSALTETRGRESMPILAESTGASLRELLLTYADRMASLDRELPEILTQAINLHYQIVSGEMQVRAQMAKKAALRMRVEHQIGDLNGYLAQPVRQHAEIDFVACLEASADGPMLPPEPMDVEQIEACLQSFSYWALHSSATPELVGDSRGPFAEEHLGRELLLAPVQRRRYFYGHMTEEGWGSCDHDVGELLNPLEWALGTSAYLHFLERWPGQVVPSKALEKIEELIAVGGSSAARGCSAEDSFYALLGRYIESVAQLRKAIQEQAATWREGVVAEGSDIYLGGSEYQATAFRPAERPITPCNGVPSCGVDLRLPSDHALLSAFPSVFLLAEQIEMGRLELCYSDIGWVDRRSEPATHGGEELADYHGRLSMKLHGRFVASEGSSEVFEKSVRSKNEYHYLFGPRTNAVASMACPSSILGDAVEVRLASPGFSLVPRRLTYLIAARTDPEAVILANWEGGDGWRRSLHGAVAVPVEVERRIAEAVHRRMRLLSIQLNTKLLTALLAPREEELGRMLRRIELLGRELRAFVVLDLPQRVLHDAPLRSLLWGETGLVDRRLVVGRQAEAKASIGLLDELLRREARAQRLLDSRSPSTPVISPFVWHTDARLRAAYRRWSRN